VTQVAGEKYKFRIFSNDSKMINKQYKQKLEFFNPITTMMPTNIQYPLIIVKCKVKDVAQKNNTKTSFDY
jgi:hypothetical protein